MSAIDREPFPRGALIGVAALLSLSIVATAAARLSRIHAPAPSASAANTAIASIDLGFADESDGAVSVHESHSGRLLATLSPGTNGFVRGVLRGLAHDRLRHGLGPSAPFRLSEFPGGRLALLDTATGRLIDLEAFGGDNRAAFLKFLPTAGARS